MKWARMKDNIVQEVVDIDPQGRFTDDIFLQFETCPNHVECNWRKVESRWEPPSPAYPTLDEIRAQRDLLLTQSDWTQIADSPLSSSQKEAWRVYRQELRDLTNDIDLKNVIFPKMPEV